jgi:hypothetical protein
LESIGKASAIKINGTFLCLYKIILVNIKFLFEIILLFE